MTQITDGYMQQMMDGTYVCGVAIFSTDTEETTQIMQDDPAVKQGIFCFELHPAVSFPGDRLAG